MTIIARRQFAAALSRAVVVAWPVPAGAQQPATPVIPKESSPNPAFAKAMEGVNAKLKDPQSAHYGEMVRKLGPNLNGNLRKLCLEVSTMDMAGTVHLSISSRMEPHS